MKQIDKAFGTPNGTMVIWRPFFSLNFIFFIANRKKIPTANVDGGDSCIRIIRFEKGVTELTDDRFRSNIPMDICREQQRLRSCCGNILGLLPSHCRFGMHIPQ